MVLEYLNLTFDIQNDCVKVLSEFQVTPKTVLNECVLNGSAKLLSIQLDNQILDKNQYIIKIQEKRCKKGVITK